MWYIRYTAWEHGTMNNFRWANHIGISNDPDGKSLWWHYNTKDYVTERNGVWDELHTKHNRSHSCNHARCYSIRAFRRHLRKKAKRINGIEYYLWTRIANNDVYATWFDGVPPEGFVYHEILKVKNNG